MCRLGSDYVFAILLYRGGTGNGVHFGNILFGGTRHTGADDIDKGEDAGFRWIYDRSFEVGEILPPRPAGIDDSSHSVGQCVWIRK